MNMQAMRMEFGRAFSDVMASGLASGPSGIMQAGKRQLSRAREGQVTGVSSLTPLALALVSVAIVVAIGSIVLSETEAATNNSNATSVINKALDALQTFGDFFVVIVIIGIAAVLFILLSVVRRAGRNSQV